MAFIDNLQKARQEGITDDIILQEVMLQNPNKKEFRQALDEGITPTIILDEVARQNAPAVGKQGRILGGILGDYISRVGKKQLSSAYDLAKAPLEAEMLDKEGRELAALSRRTIVPFTATSKIIAAPVTEGLSMLAEPLLTPLVEKITSSPGFEQSAVPQIVEKVNEWSKLHPEAAENLGNVFSIIGSATDILGAGALKQPAQQALKGVTQGTQKAIQAGKGILPSATKTAVTSEGKLANSVWERIQPILTETEKNALVPTGRIVEKGPLKKLKLLPSDREKEMIEIATPYVAESKNSLDASVSMRKGIEELATNLRKNMRTSQAIWNKNELKSALSKVEIPISITQPDLPIANKLKQAILKLANTADKKAVGILDLRQQFDDVVESNFGKTVFAKDDPKGILVRNYRKVLNDFAETKIPDKIFKDGTTYLGELKKQRLLFEAIENTAPRVGNIDSNIISAWIKAHPGKAEVAKYLLGGTIGTAILSKMSK